MTSGLEEALRHIDETEQTKIKRHLISVDFSLLEALKSLNTLSGDTMTLFVVDDAGKLYGSLTDGDIRRALISGDSLESAAGKACRKGCIRVDVNDPNPTLRVSEAKKMGLVLLPLTKEGFVISMIDLRKASGYLPIDAILMAGGAGERLRPLTQNTPKPLLPIGGKPIIDYNIENLICNGIHRVYITVNYLADKIIRHCEERWNDCGKERVVCVKEPFKTGTIGSLRLIREPLTEDFIVMNSDLLTDIDFEAMYLHHLQSAATLTIAVTPYTVSVPFAIIEHEGDRVMGLTEKPTYNYFANAGIYIMKKEVLKLIPENGYMDATDLIDKLLEGGKRVSQYVIDGRWIDIGSPDDYRHACELMET